MSQRYTSQNVLRLPLLLCFRQAVEFWLSDSTPCPGLNATKPVAAALHRLRYLPVHMIL